MLLNKLKLTSQKLSTRITAMHLLLYILILLIIQLMVIFLTQQFLLSNNHEQLEQSRNYIIRFCDKNKETILNTKPEDRLQLIATQLLSTREISETVNIYMSLKDNLGNSYQPYSPLINLEKLGFNKKPSLDEYIFLFGDRSFEAVPVIVLNDKDNKYIYVNTAIQFDEDYTLTVQLVKDIKESMSYLNILIAAIIISGFIGIIIILIFGRVATKRALLPLTKIANTTKHITEKNLNKRLPAPGTNDEIDVLIKALNEMIERLENAFNAQRNFVSDASHELRIPLTVIQGYIEILDSWGLQNEKILEESISAIKQESINMKILVEKLLFLARVENNRLKLKFKKINISELIERVYSDSQIISPEHTFQILHIEDCWIHGDEHLLLQMLRNTVDNSIKYTPSGGKISFFMKSLNGMVCISIQDTGIGIPKEDIPKVCNRFYRVDKTRSKSTGGYGLGLSITQTIITLHRGTMKIDSIFHHGTTVTFQIPEISH